MVHRGKGKRKREKGEGRRDSREFFISLLRA
jgi:hypothetical protein